MACDYGVLGKSPLFLSYVLGKAGCDVNLAAGVPLFDFLGILYGLAPGLVVEEDFNIASSMSAFLLDIADPPVAALFLPAISEPSSRPVGEALPTCSGRKRKLSEFKFSAVAFLLWPPR